MFTLTAFYRIKVHFTDIDRIGLLTYGTIRWLSRRKVATVGRRNMRAIDRMRMRMQMRNYVMRKTLCVMENAES